MGWSFGKDPFTGFLNVAGNAIGDTIYNASTGSSGYSGTAAAWDKYINPNKSSSSGKSSGGGGGGGGWGGGSGSSKKDTSESDKYDAEYARLLASINSYTPPVPRFVDYNIGASWDRARKMAAKAVNPVYKAEMDRFLKRQKVELGRQKSDIGSQKDALDLALNRLLEDTGVTRGRTVEDTTTNIQDIQDTNAFATRQESLNFDAANRALNENLGAGGMAESGLGQQAVQEQQQVRREQSNEQIRQMDNQIEAQNTLMNRTFQDLEMKESRSTSDTKTGKKKLDIDLERFIEDQRYDREEKKASVSARKAADIAQKSIGIQGQLVDQWLATLSGQGYTAQEIANAASMYK